jgi:hypothetical protein
MNDGTLDFITTIFSHELVESCLECEAIAILGIDGTCNQGGWREIRDVHESNNNRPEGKETLPRNNHPKPRTPSTCDKIKGVNHLNLTNTKKARSWTLKYNNHNSK